MQGHLNVLREMYYPDVCHTPPMVRFSRRLTRNGGYWNPRTNQMVLSSRLFQEHGPDELLNVLKHELIHWAVWEPGEEQPHGWLFRQEAERLGCDIQCLAFAQHKWRTSNKRYLYTCPTCEARVVRKKQGTLSCATCHPEGYDEAYALVLAERRILT